jgi:serine/threonine protein kinase/formylglycine-generating enzyme required for sulfatase activity
VPGEASAPVIGEGSEPLHFGATAHEATLAGARSGAGAAPPGVATEGPGLALFGEAAERYEVRGELGRGGMGAVFRVFDRDLEREVALKVLFDDVGADPGCTARFLAEARAMAGLQHTGIIPVYDFGVDARRRAYFTMRLVEGRTLARVIADARSGSAEEARAFSLFRVLELVVEAANAVAYAHSRGVIHRDLKPQNVMVGSFGEVQVMDWGLAKDVRRLGARPARPAARSPGDPVDRAAATERLPPSGAAAGTGTLPWERRGGGTGTAPAPLAAPAEPDVPGSGSSSHRLLGGSPSDAATIHGMIIGTPAYMAPEQTEGDPSLVGPAADVFALGAILYHALTGRPPYHAEEGEDPLEKARTLDYPRPRALDPSIPPELEAISVKAMAARPAERYVDALAFVRDVQAFLEHEPVSAYPEGLAARARKWAKRHRHAIALAASAIALATLGALALVRLEDARAAREIEEARGAVRREGERLLLEADRRTGDALAAYVRGRAPLWERRAAVLQGGELAAYFGAPPESEVEARDRLLAEGEPAPPPGEALALHRSREAARLLAREEGRAIATEADALYRRAHDRLIEAQEGARAERAEARRLLALARFASAQGRPEAAAGYLDAAARRLGPEDAPAVEETRARAALRVSIAGPSGGGVAPEASLHKVDPRSLATDPRPLPGHERLPLPFEARDLAPGEYVVAIREAGAAPDLAAAALSFPVLLAPGDRWESAIPVSLAAIPPGMRYVPAGPALVGSQVFAPEERPPRFIHLPAFMIGRCETTVAELAAQADGPRAGTRTAAEVAGRGGIYVENVGYRLVAGASFRDPVGAGLSLEEARALPAAQLTFAEAREHARARGLRLPSELEWEKAARGIDGRRYPWGQGAPDSGGIFRANFFQFGEDADGYEHHAPVGAFPEGRSPYGCLDMVGNAYEYVGTGMAPYRDLVDVRADDPSARRIYRGCGYFDEGADVRITYRSQEETPGYYDSTTGFRLAADAPW